MGHEEHRSYGPAAGAAAGRAEAHAAARAMELIGLLAEQIGPRRPTGRGERLAAEAMRSELARVGLSVRLERFAGYPSFALPYGAILGLAVAPGLLPAGMHRLRAMLAVGAAAALASEGDLRFTPLSRALSRWDSANLVAEIAPVGGVQRTLCLSAHLDSSRSGLLFHPRLVRHLGAWISVQSAACLGQAGEPLLRRSAGGRRLLAAMRGVLAVALGLLVERELRGEDVPGANDNASGCAVAAQLATELAAKPLASTRVVLLLTGCEEAGTLGAQRFLDRHSTADWLFLNFDNVGGGGTLRFLRREGVIAKWSADPGLVRVAESVAGAHPELRMAPEDSPAGLTFDSSPVLARGGRAITLSVQDGYIPNLHWPTDTYENVDRGGVARALTAGRAIVRAIDAGGAD